jgi:hypothetical protein
MPPKVHPGRQQPRPKPGRPRVDFPKDPGSIEPIGGDAMLRIMVLLLSSPLFAFAAPESALKKIEVHAQLVIDGQIVSSPSILTEDGERAEISTFQNGKRKDRVKMAVVAQRDPASTDLVDLKIDLEFSDGQQTIKSSPFVLAKAGEEEVILLDGEGDQLVELRISATPK